MLKDHSVFGGDKLIITFFWVVRPPAPHPRSQTLGGESPMAGMFEFPGILSCKGQNSSIREEK